MATGWVYDNAFLAHDTGPGHPETASRLRAIVTRLTDGGLLRRLTNITARPAVRAEILANHTAAHWERVKDICRRGSGLLDPDTPISPGSWEAALLAVGGVLELCDAVLDGKIANGFAAVRPPGHHAETDKAMGFCLFNNIAIAARYLLEQREIKRVLIVDWDAHHGNGTQEAFYRDKHVFYFSIHQFPCYPGSGTPAQTGTGEGERYTLNVPLDPWNGDDEFLAAFTDRLVPAVRDFAPEFVLLSAGFDAHRADPLASLNVSDEGFIRAGLIVRQIADEHCAGRWVSTLEGGYDLNALAVGVENLLRVKLGELAKDED